MKQSIGTTASPILFSSGIHLSLWDMLFTEETTEVNNQYKIRIETQLRLVNHEIKENNPKHL